MKGLMHDSAGAIEEKTSYEVAFLQHAITEELSDKRDTVYESEHTCLVKSANVRKY